MNSLDFLKNLLKSSGKDVIKKAAVEKIIDMNFKSLRDEVIPSFLELTKIKEELFNPSVVNILSGNTQAKTGLGQVKVMLGLAKSLLSQEQDVKKAIKQLPEHLPVKYITTQNAYIITLLTSVCNFTLSSMDVAISYISKGDSEFSNSINSQMLSSISSINLLIPYIKELKSNLNKIDKADNEINIYDENTRLEAILKAKGGLPDIPNMGFAFIGRVAYNIGTWIVDLEYKKYEALKAKKNYLLKRLLELDNQISAKPEDIKLKNAKDVYINEIEKISFAINKMEVS